MHSRKKILICWSSPVLFCECKHDASSWFIDATNKKTKVKRILIAARTKVTPERLR